MANKVLIIGNSAKAHSLARIFSKNNKVYITSQSHSVKDFAETVDIRPADTMSILNFVKSNKIDLTIPFSREVLETDIVSLFSKKGLNIFAPDIESSNIIFDKAFTKKLLYKLRIPTPKFGIFEKTAPAIDYIKNSANPYVIKTNDSSSATITTSDKIAKNIIESFLAEKLQKIVIEDYIWGMPFCFYVITDGYKALPIGSSRLYKHILEGEGGQLTSGMGSVTPNIKLSQRNEDYLINNVIYPFLEYINSINLNYAGILGVNCIISEDNSIQVLNFQPYTNDCDTSAILENIDMDIFKLFESCTVGSFSDEIDEIILKDLAAVSVVLYRKNKKNDSNNIIKGLENIQEDISIDFYSGIERNRYLEYETKYGENIVLTAHASTINAAAKKVYSELDNISFDSLYYRRDIADYNKNLN